MQNNIINIAEFLDDKDSKVFDAPLNSSRKAKLSKDPAIIKGKILKFKEQAAASLSPETKTKATVLSETPPLAAAPVEVENQAPPVASEVQVAQAGAEVTEPKQFRSEESIAQSLANKGASIILVNETYDPDGTHYNRLRVSSQVVDNTMHANYVGLKNLQTSEPEVQTPEVASPEVPAAAPTVASPNPLEAATVPTVSQPVAPIEPSEIQASVGTPAETPSLQSFDFNQTVDLKNIEGEAETEVTEEPLEAETKPSVNIDDYIGITNDTASEEYTLDEMKKLQSENDSLKESIETQLGVLKSLKEKQEELRKQKIVLIDDYRAQKAEYTQKLNTILEEINRATDEVEAEQAYIEEVKSRMP